MATLPPNPKYNVVSKKIFQEEPKDIGYNTAHLSFSK